MFSIALRQLFNKNAVVTARMTHSLKGKVALVTGASRGLGKAFENPRKPYKIFKNSRKFKTFEEYF